MGSLLSIYNCCCVRKPKPKFPENGFYNDDVAESMNENNIPPCNSRWTRLPDVDLITMR